jgi:hypothetical protein
MRHATRHATRRAALALALPVLLAAVGPAAAAPVPAFSISITETWGESDDTCILNAKAGWKIAKIDSVVLTWYYGGTTLVATGTAPGTGPYDGVIKAKAGIFSYNAGSLGPPPTWWRVTAQYFTAGGLQGEAVLEFDSLCG